MCRGLKNSLNPPPPPCPFLALVLESRTTLKRPPSPQWSFALWERRPGKRWWGGRFLGLTGSCGHPLTPFPLFVSAQNCHETGLPTAAVATVLQVPSQTRPPPPGHTVPFNQRPGVGEWHPVAYPLYCPEQTMGLLPNKRAPHPPPLGRPKGEGFRFCGVLSCRRPMHSAAVCKRVQDTRMQGMIQFDGRLLPHFCLTATLPGGFRVSAPPFPLAGRAPRPLCTFRCLKSGIQHPPYPFGVLVSL